jgi:hypothetical protein
VPRCRYLNGSGEASFHYEYLNYNSDEQKLNLVNVFSETCLYFIWYFRRICRHYSDWLLCKRKHESCWRRRTLFRYVFFLVYLKYVKPILIVF